MAGRPAASQASSTLRLEILKELQQLTESREARDRLDRSPLAEAKGREHWVLHLLLKASEIETAHTDTLIGSAYSNLLARLEAVEDRIGRMEEVSSSLDGAVKSRLENLDQLIGDRIDRSLVQGTEKLAVQLTRTIQESLDRKWEPIGESTERFAEGSKQLVKGVDDTFRLAAQTRLLLNDNARRLSDLGRDIVALEDSLKLVVARTIEEGLALFDQRLRAIERQMGLAAGEGGSSTPPAKTDQSLPSGA
ncbi:MAG: hypothetical protein ACYDFT_02720 [Thermoplasmata archaeon]